MCRAPLENGVPPMGFSLDEINWGMAEAAFLGYLDIVRLMLFRGATNHNHTMSIAAFYGHESIVRLLLDHGASDYNTALRRAALNHQEHIVRLIRERMNSQTYLGFLLAYKIPYFHN